MTGQHPGRSAVRRSLRGAYSSSPQPATNSLGVEIVAIGRLPSRDRILVWSTKLVVGITLLKPSLTDFDSRHSINQQPPANGFARYRNPDSQF